MSSLLEAGVAVVMTYAARQRHTAYTAARYVAASTHSRRPWRGGWGRETTQAAHHEVLAAQGGLHELRGPRKEFRETILDDGCHRDSRDVYGADTQCRPASAGGIVSWYATKAHCQKAAKVFEGQVLWRDYYCSKSLALGGWHLKWR
jgi:hypothetical protein